MVSQAVNTNNAYVIEESINFPCDP